MSDDTPSPGREAGSLRHHTPLTLLSMRLGGPETADRAALDRFFARWATEEGRTADVVRYLLAASTGGQLPQEETGRGSLKHLLWWLRDHARSLYVEAVMMTLQAALDGTWPLREAEEHLRDHPHLGPLVQRAQAHQRRDSLAQILVWEDVAGWRVAWNYSEVNLAKVSLTRGADCYVAVSSEGGCVMARRPLILTAPPPDADGGWVQPYPNLAVLKRPGRVEDISVIRAYLPGAIQPPPSRPA